MYYKFTVTVNNKIKSVEVVKCSEDEAEKLINEIYELYNSYYANNPKVNSVSVEREEYEILSANETKAVLLFKRLAEKYFIDNDKDRKTLFNVLGKAAGSEDGNVDDEKGINRLIGIIKDLLG